MLPCQILPYRCNSLYKCCWCTGAITKTKQLMKSMCMTEYEDMKPRSPISVTVALSSKEFVCVWGCVCVLLHPSLWAMFGTPSRTFFPKPCCSPHRWLSYLCGGFCFPLSPSRLFSMQMWLANVTARQGCFRLFLSAGVASALQSQENQIIEPLIFLSNPACLLRGKSNLPGQCSSSVWCQQKWSII